MSSVEKKFTLVSQTLEKMHGVAFIKDLNHRFVAGNQNMMDLFCLEQDEQVRSVDDEYVVRNTMSLTLPNTQISDYVNSFVEETENVFRGVPQHILDAHHYSGKLHVYVTHKSPIYGDDGKVIGALTHGIEIPYKTINIDKFLQTHGIRISSFSEYNVRRYLSSIIGAYSLTKREFECLEMLAKGYTAKKIGQLLGISFRTVEFYIEKIKVKFDCNTKDQLIDKYLDIKINIHPEPEAVT